MSGTFRKGVYILRLKGFNNSFNCCLWCKLIHLEHNFTFINSFFKLCVIVVNKRYNFDSFTEIVIRPLSSSFVPVLCAFSLQVTCKVLQEYKQETLTQDLHRVLSLFSLSLKTFKLYVRRKGETSGTTIVQSTSIDSVVSYRLREVLTMTPHLSGKLSLTVLGSVKVFQVLSPFSWIYKKIRQGDRPSFHLLSRLSLGYLDIGTSTPPTSPRHTLSL